MVTAASDQQQKFHEELSALIGKTPAATMLTPAIQQSFQNAMQTLGANDKVKRLSATVASPAEGVSAQIFETSADIFLQDLTLQEEMFGPSSLQVTARDNREMLAVARALPGQITASVWGTEQDLLDNRELIDILEQKAGRIILNGVPTGVEVVHAMNHGGPYPATTDSKFTSVGSQSIYRFTRPVCFQNYPDELLPDELKEANPLGIDRMVNGTMQTGRS